MIIETLTIEIIQERPDSAIIAQYSEKEKQILENLLTELFNSSLDYVVRVKIIGTKVAKE